MRGELRRHMKEHDPAGYVAFLAKERLRDKARGRTGGRDKGRPKPEGPKRRVYQTAISGKPLPKRGAVESVNRFATEQMIEPPGLGEANCKALFECGKRGGVTWLKGTCWSIKDVGSVYDLSQWMGDEERLRWPNDPGEALTAVCDTIGDLFGDLPPRLYGPGSVASMLMRKHGLREHMPRPEYLPWEQETYGPAYYGGRIQALRLGHFDTVTRIDMRSAYAWSMLKLPSLNLCFPGDRHPEMIRVKTNYKFDFGDDACSGCLPVRGPDGELTYPPSGVGTYLEDEIRGIRWGKQHRTTGWAFNRHEGGEPFRWLWDYLQLREQYRGHREEQIIKRCINAVYGKLAQSSGRSGWQCLTWAALCTAKIRLEMRTLMDAFPGKVLAIMTDGVLIEGEVSPPGTFDVFHLGYSTEHLRDVWVFGPTLWCAEGQECVSGYKPGEFPWERAINLFRKRGPFAEVETMVSRYRPYYPGAVEPGRNHPETLHQSLHPAGTYCENKTGEETWDVCYPPGGMSESWRPRSERGEFGYAGDWQSYIMGA